MNFLKNFAAAFLGCIVAFVIICFFTMIIFVAIATSMASWGSQPVTISNNTILKIDLNTPITERSSKNPFAGFDYFNMSPKSELGLNDILKNIRKAKNDSRIKGIYLNLSTIYSGIATVEEIRDALVDFKESGKFIISYSDTYSQKAYYLATVADKVYLNPTGNFLLKGMSSQIMFFKKALDKLDIEVQIIRHGKFKSAVEPLMLDQMSPENREQTSTFVNSIWGVLLETIAESRNVSKSDLNQWINHLEIFSAQSTLDKKLIDGLLYQDQVMAELAELTGQQPDDLNMVTLSKYIRTNTNIPTFDVRQKIAVIYAQGDIMMGSGSKDITSEDMSEAIRQARKDSTIKAIVFRINSGGGSALASDIISREIQLAAEVKPVIASFGDVAASGGYYIATQASMIVADRTTITGSIGVFGIIPNLKGFLNNKLGLTSDMVNTNKYSDMPTIMRPMTAEEKELMQWQVEDVYDTFITRVSTGRGMDKAAVDEIGQGRVWSAVDAKRIGLVDEWGGVAKAIELAADKAQISNYEVVELPKQPNPLEAFMSSFNEEISIRVIRRELGDSYKYYRQLNDAVHLQGVQARMPYTIELY